jgi:choline dehydrogenase-like flavoprotein
MSNCAFLTYPFSRGRIHITGPGLDDPLDLDLGLLTDPDDADLLAARMLYNVQRDVMRRMRTYRGELPATHPAFAPTSRAACVELDGPLPEDAPACIEYSTDDDVAIDCWVRENVATAWHSLGTCKMASRDKGGVVDATLGVHGLQALKVADLSIAPGNVGCNTAATTYTIAEKAADIFIQELGLGEA